MNIKFKKVIACILSITFICSVIYIISIQKIPVTAENKSLSKTDISNYNGQIAQQFMSEKELEELLKKENFDSDKITYAKFLSAQIVFALDEITRDNIIPSQNTLIDKAQDAQTIEDISNFSKLKEQFDQNQSVYFALKLEEAFGGVQQVLDEYLYCLQTDIDLFLYLENKEVYEKEILEKELVIPRNQATTVDKILQYKQNSEVLNATNQSVVSEHTQENLVQNEIEQNLIKPHNPRPVDPAEQVKQEIKELQNSIISK